MNVLLLLQEHTRIQRALLHSPPGHLVYHKGRYGASSTPAPRIISVSRNIFA